MDKKILITGGAGFIGANLIKVFYAKGYEITVLDNLSHQVHGKNPEEFSVLYNEIKDKVHFIKASVTNKEALLNALAENTLIVHLAAETGTGQSMYEIEKYTNINIQGTALLLDLLSNNKHSVKKLVVASSRAIYGEGKYLSKEKGAVYPVQRTNAAMQLGNFEVEYEGCKELSLTATDELSIIHPTSVYGITKQVQEQLVMTVCPNIGISPVALRYQNVYGPGQSLSNPYTGILSIFSTRINNNAPINIFEDGKESRDFIYIDDVVAATILAIENEQANGQVFNVGSGKATSVETVVKVLMQKMQQTVPYHISGNYRLGDIRHNYADITKIQSLLGFQPKFSFEQGVENFVAWVKKQQAVPDLYEQSLNEMKQKKMFQ